MTGTINTPSRRLNVGRYGNSIEQLAEQATFPAIDPKVNIGVYYRTGIAMYQKATEYDTKGEIELAYIFFLKFQKFLLELLPRHKAFSATPNQFSKEIDLLKQYIPVAKKTLDELKNELSSYYDQDSNNEKEDKTTAQKEVKKEEVVATQPITYNNIITPLPLQPQTVSKPTTNHYEDNEHNDSEFDLDFLRNYTKVNNNNNNINENNNNAPAKKQNSNNNMVNNISNVNTNDLRAELNNFNYKNIEENTQNKNPLKNSANNLPIENQVEEVYVMVKDASGSMKMVPVSQVHSPSSSSPKIIDTSNQPPSNSPAVNNKNNGNVYSKADLIANQSQNIAMNGNCEETLFLSLVSSDDDEDEEREDDGSNLISFTGSSLSTPLISIPSSTPSLLDKDLEELSKVKKEAPSVSGLSNLLAWQKEINDLFVKEDISPPPPPPQSLPPSFNVSNSAAMDAIDDLFNSVNKSIVLESTLNNVIYPSATAYSHMPSMTSPPLSQTPSPSSIPLSSSLSPSLSPPSIPSAIPFTANPIPLLATPLSNPSPVLATPLPIPQLPIGQSPYSIPQTPFSLPPRTPSPSLPPSNPIPQSLPPIYKPPVHSPLPSPSNSLNYSAPLNTPQPSSSTPSLNKNDAKTNFAFNGKLRNISVDGELFEEFVRFAELDLAKKIETCGVLAGFVEDDQIKITSIIIPKQTGTSDTCTTTNEDELLLYITENNYQVIGWIHTHPTQNCFLSSMDLHAQFSYQVLLPEAIAAVVSPLYNPNFGIFRLTNAGMQVVGNCTEKGFHPHDKSTDLFEVCEHVTINWGNPTSHIFDLR